jgi:hypothetical protein
MINDEGFGRNTEKEENEHKKSSNTQARIERNISKVIT